MIMNWWRGFVAGLLLGLIGLAWCGIWHYHDSQRLSQSIVYVLDCGPTPRGVGDILCYNPTRKVPRWSTKEGGFVGPNP